MYTALGMDPPLFSFGGSARFVNDTRGYAFDRGVSGAVSWVWGGAKYLFDSFLLLILHDIKTKYYIRA